MNIYFFYFFISKLYSTFKIFEKLILKGIMEIHSENGVDLRGVVQHKFEIQKSTQSLNTKQI